MMRLSLHYFLRKFQVPNLKEFIICNESQKSDNLPVLKSDQKSIDQKNSKAKVFL